MKTEKTFVDSHSIPWSRVNENISTKILNGQSDKGPYTAILKSEPRAPDPHRGQYHTVDEEFYCLGGRFTFDGTHWFHKGSYVHFPAHYVHGANVHVKDGYLLYLRISGTVTLDFVENPKSNFPYLLDGATSPLKPTVHRRVAMVGKSIETHGVDWLRSRLLKVDPHSGEGSTLLDWGQNASRCHVLLSSKKELELFIVSGAFENDTGDALQQGAYAFYTGKSVDIPLRITMPGRILVSHSAELDITIL